MKEKLCMTILMSPDILLTVSLPGREAYVTGSRLLINIFCQNAGSGA